MTRAVVASLVVGALLSIGTGKPATAETTDADFALYDAHVLDRKGVATDLKDFGYMTGVNIFMAYRGEADVEIPWRLIRSLDIGEFVAETRRASVTATMRSGKVYALEVDAIEYERMLRGKAEFGEYRIRLGKTRRIELVGFTQSGPN